MVYIIELYSVRYKSIVLFLHTFHSGKCKPMVYKIEGEDTVKCEASPPPVPHDSVMDSSSPSIPMAIENVVSPPPVPHDSVMVSSSPSIPMAIENADEDDVARALTEGDDLNAHSNQPSEGSIKVSG